MFFLLTNKSYLDILVIERVNMKTYIVNGLVCFEEHSEVCDIEITEDYISDIGVNLPRENGAKVIDAKGKLVLPGLVDFHAHFQETVGPYSSNETYTTGTNVALLNGITTVNCFVSQNFNQSLAVAIGSAIEKAKNNIFCDVRWHLTPTRFSDINYNDISKWIEKGFTSFKFYTTYKQSNLYLPYEKLLEIVRRLNRYDPTIIVHCEDEAVMNSARISNGEPKNIKSQGLIRNEEAELFATEKVIDICKQTQVNIVIAHVSSSDTLGQIELAKRECPLICEVTPHYVFLNDDLYNQENGHKYLIIPPLRNEECRELMQKKVLMDYADIFSSNHRTYSKQDKDRSKADYRQVPSGIPTIGALFHLFSDLFINQYDFPLHVYVRKISSNPARMAGIYPQKGVIAINSDADIIVVNPNATPKTIIPTLVDSYNPWEDFKTGFSIDFVFLRGQMVVKDNKLVNEENKSGKILCDIS